MFPFPGNSSSALSGFNLTPVNKAIFYPASGIVAAYKAAVITAGDTLPSAHEQILLQALSTYMGTTAFAKTRVLHIPLGNALSGALCFQIVPAGGPTAWINNGFVTGDYTPTTGIKGNGVKRLTSTINPSTITPALVANNWGLAVHTLSNSLNDLGVMAGCSAAPDYCYVGYGGASSTASDSLGRVAVKRIGTHLGMRMNFVQGSAASGNTEAGVGGFIESQSTNSGSSLVPNATLTMFSDGTSFVSTMLGTGFALFDAMTQTERLALSNLFDTVNYNVGRAVFAANLVCLGDSITAGQGVSTGARWTALLAASLGLTEVNYGAGGATALNIQKIGSSGTDNTYEAFNYNTLGTASAQPLGNTFTGGLPSMYKSKLLPAAFKTFAIGLNDLTYSNNDAAIVGALTADIDGELATGTAPANLLVCSTTYSPGAASVTGSYWTAPRAVALNASLLTVAQSRGCKFADFYSAWNAGNVATYTQDDQLHPNAAGDVLLAAIAYAAIAAPAPVGTLGVQSNTSAAAGYVGEIITALVASGSAVALTNNTAANVTSISLTPGDWDVEGSINFAGTTATVTGGSGGINTTTATVPTDGSEGYDGTVTTLLSDTSSIPLTRKPIKLAATTTVYLVAKKSFSAGTVGAFGAITARRMR